MILYNKLNALLKKRNITWTEIRTRLRFSSSTVAKINKNEVVSLEVIDKLCDYLAVQPGDILEFESEKPTAKILEEYENIITDPNTPITEKLAKSLELGLKFGNGLGKKYNYNKPIKNKKDKDK
jgi:hypothetical protein